MATPTTNNAGANPAPLETSDIDGWVESLMQCKQLSENDVKRLCEKVSEQEEEGASELKVGEVGGEN